MPKMKPPEKGKKYKPKRMATKNMPGGPMTPGAKKKKKVMRKKK